MKIIHRLIFIVCILIVFLGILKVNIEFNRLNGNAYNKKNYEGIYENNKKSCDAFGELTINRKTGNIVKIYIDYSPLDIRFSIGRKIIYINGTVLEKVEQRIKSIADRI